MNRFQNTALVLGLSLCINCLPAIADSQGKFPGIGSAEAYHRTVDICQRAELCYKKGDYETACTLYKKAISIYPHDSATHQNLGNALRKVGKLEESATCQKKAIELEPNFVSAWLGLGMSYEFMHKLTEAEKCYRTAVRIKPDSYGAVFDLGDILRQQGKYAEAKTWLTRAKLCPKNDPNELDNALRLCDQHMSKEASN